MQSYPSRLLQLLLVPRQPARRLIYPNTLIFPLLVAQMLDLLVILDQQKITSDSTDKSRFFLVDCGNFW